MTEIVPISEIDFGGASQPVGLRFVKVKKRLFRLWDRDYVGDSVILKKIMFEDNNVYSEHGNKRTLRKPKINNDFSRLKYFFLNMEMYLLCVRTNDIL